MTDTQQKTRGRDDLIEQLGAISDGETRVGRHGHAEVIDAAVARIARLEDVATNLLSIAAWMERRFPYLERYGSMPTNVRAAIDEATAALGGEEAICERLRSMDARKHQSET